LSRLLFNPSDSIYPASVWFACPFSIHNKLWVHILTSCD
jgi:hypothetical protein